MSDYDKNYIAYNIHCFFHYYCLEERIIKVNADCIILDKMIKEVYEMCNSKKRYHGKSADNAVNRKKFIENRRLKFSRESTKQTITASKSPVLRGGRTKKRNCHGVVAKSSDCLRQSKTPRSKKAKIAQEKYNIYTIKKSNNKTPNTVKALYYSLQSGFFQTNQKVKIIFNIKPIFKLYKDSIPSLLSEVIAKLTEKYTLGREYLNKYKNIALIVQPFRPSKAALNGLKFLTFSEEEKLFKAEEHKKELINIFKFFLVLLKEEYNEVPDKDIIVFLKEKIYQKYKCKTLKELILNHALKNIKTLTSKEYEELATLHRETPRIFSPKEMISISRTLSYISFIVKEVHSYIFEKCEDGTTHAVLREINESLNELHKIINKLKKFKV